MCRPLFYFPATLIVFLSATLANAEIITVSTANHPLPSQCVIEVYLGNIEPLGGILIYTSEPLALSGTAILDVQLDALNSGSVQIVDSHIDIEDISPRTVDLLGLGTVDVSTTGLVLRVTSGLIAVAETAFTITNLTTGSLDVIAGQGTASNPTGVVADFIPGGETIDFSIDPLIGPFSLFLNDASGTVDDDASLFASGPEFNLGNPIFVVDDPLFEPLVYLRFVAKAHLSAIPELSSMFFIVVVSSVGLAAIALRRRNGFRASKIFWTRDRLQRALGRQRSC